MSAGTLKSIGPSSSVQLASVDLVRVAEVGRRHKLLTDLIRQDQLDGLLLTDPSSFAWATCGGQNERGGNTGTNAALFYTSQARVILCNNADTATLFEHEVASLGFQLKERPWTEPRLTLINDLCRGRNVACDFPDRNMKDVSVQLQNMRVPLTNWDHQLLREAGSIVAHSVEATARGLTPDRIEQEVAGELAHRMLKRGMTPHRMQILSGNRMARFPHWTFGPEAIGNGSCTIVAVGEYRGLFVGCGRTIAFQKCPSSLLADFEKAAMVTATAFFFSQAEWCLGDIWSRVQRIYEKTGAENDWRLTDQADVIEYEFGNISILPNSEYRLSPGAALFWHPQVGSARLCDSLLVVDNAAEILTPPADWPKISIGVKGVPVGLPGILILE